MSPNLTDYIRPDAGTAIASLFPGHTDLDSAVLWDEFFNSDTSHQICNDQIKHIDSLPLPERGGTIMVQVFPASLFERIAGALDETKLNLPQKSAVYYIYIRNLMEGSHARYSQRIADTYANLVRREKKDFSAVDELLRSTLNKPTTDEQ